MVIRRTRSIAPFHFSSSDQQHGHLLRFHRFEISSWDGLLRCYISENARCSKLPFSIFKQILALQIRPSLFTFPPLLKLLTKTHSISEAIQIHAVVSKLGLVHHIYVSNSLIALYSNSNQMHLARNLFDEMPIRNSVSYNSMISGFSQNGLYEESLNLFNEMREKNYGMDKVTMVSALPACAHLGAVTVGEWICNYAKDKGETMCVHLATALIDMYSKCGLVEKAQKLFDEMPERNIVTWNAMINGFAIHGLSKQAFHTFDELRNSTTACANHVTLVALLTACLHCGHVAKGREYFDLMSQNYGIEPTIQHYTCMVVLLGRAGNLKGALSIVETMPCKADGVIWGALLGACRLHRNVEIGQKALGQLQILEPKNYGNFVIFSNTMAAIGMWDEAEKIRRNGNFKIPGCSWIEVNSKVHRFFSWDRSHPLIRNVYRQLEELQKKIAAFGYTHHIDSALRDVEEEDKEDMVRFHSEKLALSFGILILEPNATIRIVKNLRVCLDCHNVFQLISRIEGRSIILRDNSRFHHFRDGCCSCMDYW